MQITTESTGQSVELRIAGRLDNESSDQLSSAIEDAVRQGCHSVTLDLGSVEYISSAGVGALVRAHKQLQSLRGSFRIVAISPEAAEVIQLTGLTPVLLSDLGKPRTAPTTPRDTQQSSIRVSERGDMTFEIYDVGGSGSLNCEVIGSPEAFASGGYQSTQCRPVEFPLTTIGLGLGAFGRDYDDCANRFGEYLSVAGAAAQQPTNASVKPDFQRVIGDFVPTVQTLYGLRCQGQFGQLVRFERTSPDMSLKLSSMVDQLLNLAQTDLCAMVILAESAGLIGAALRRSPAGSSAVSPSRFAHPEIRRWLSFTPSHAWSHTLTLAVGIAARGIPAGGASSLAPMLRPLAADIDVHAHFHAAVFSYRPFKKRKLDLNESVSALFETEDLQAVLHLVHDDRNFNGSGESEFVSGACWLGPIGSVRSVENVTNR